MTTYKHVICGSDFSESSDDAVRAALGLGEEGARVTFVHGVVLPIVAGYGAMVPVLAAVADQAEVERHALARCRAQIGRLVDGAERTARIEIAFASPTEAIVGAAESARADLVVVGSRGATGLRRMALGSVAESVVRHAPCPVLVARASPKSGRVLAAVDFSDSSRAVLRAAAAEAKRRGAGLTVVHCLDLAPPMMGLGFAPLPPASPDDPRSRVALSQRATDDARALLAELGITGDVVVEPGWARSTIPHLAEELAAALIVVGTRGRGRIARLLLGSVAESVVRHSPCPVLAVR